MCVCVCVCACVRLFWPLPYLVTTKISTEGTTTEHLFNMTSPIPITTSGAPEEGIATTDLVSTGATFNMVVTTEGTEITVILVSGFHNLYYYEQNCIFIFFL